MIATVMTDILIGAAWALGLILAPAVVMAAVTYWMARR